MEVIIISVERLMKIIMKRLLLYKLFKLSIDDSGTTDERYYIRKKKIDFFLFIIKMPSKMNVMCNNKLKSLQNIEPGTRINMIYNGGSMKNEWREVVVDKVVIDNKTNKGWLQTIYNNQYRTYHLDKITNWEKIRPNLIRTSSQRTKTCMEYREELELKENMMFDFTYAPYKYNVGYYKNVEFIRCNGDLMEVIDRGKIVTFNTKYVKDIHIIDNKDDSLTENNIYEENNLNETIKAHTTIKLLTKANKKKDILIMEMRTMINNQNITIDKFQEKCVELGDYLDQAENDIEKLQTDLDGTTRDLEEYKEISKDLEEQLDEACDVINELNKKCEPDEWDML